MIVVWELIDRYESFKKDIRVELIDYLTHEEYYSGEYLFMPLEYEDSEISRFVAHDNYITIYI